MELNEVEVLRSARDVLAENELTKGHFARKGDGYPVSANNPDAEKFCAYGAVMRAMNWTGKFPGTQKERERDRVLLNFRSRCGDFIGDAARKLFYDRLSNAPGNYNHRNPNTGEHIWKGANVVVGFNDHKETTKEDVLSVFDKAILMAKEKLNG